MRHEGRIRCNFKFFICNSHILRKSNNEIEKINGIDYQPKQNGTIIEKIIETSVSENVNMPSIVLSNHTKRVFDEANRLKAEYGGCVASLEHELEILRKWRFVILEYSVMLDLEINKLRQPIALIRTRKQSNTV